MLRRSVLAILRATPRNQAPGSNAGFPLRIAVSHVSWTTSSTSLSSRTSARTIKRSEVLCRRIAPSSNRLWSAMVPIHHGRSCRIVERVLGIAQILPILRAYFEEAGGGETRREALVEVRAMGALYDGEAGTAFSKFPTRTLADHGCWPKNAGRSNICVTQIRFRTFSSGSYFANYVKALCGWGRGPNLRCAG